MKLDVRKRTKRLQVRSFDSSRLSRARRSVSAAVLCTLAGTASACGAQGSKRAAVEGSGGTDCAVMCEPSLGSGGTGGGTSSGGDSPSGGFGPSGGSGTGGAASGGALGSGGTSNTGGASHTGGSTASGGATSHPPGSEVIIDGPRLVLGGELFFLRGVNWNPVPVGGTHPGDLDFSGFAERDVLLMVEAGINVVRTYERLEDRAVLDRLYEAGIYVFSTVYGWWQDDPSVVTERVDAVKDHPAILAWVIGNEWNYNQLYSDGALSTEQARDQLNEAAAAIKSADPNHPVATIYGEFGGLAETVAEMPDIDLWGINTYRGISHGDLFSTWESLSNQPMFLGEYGADAYNANLPGYDPESQAQATLALTQELMDHYVSVSGGVTVGGFLFEFADEWWKDGAGSPSVQDVGGIAPGGGPYPDQTFNEEYWGIVDVERNPRPAFDALKSLYNP